VGGGGKKAEKKIKEMKNEGTTNDWKKD